MLSAAELRAGGRAMKSVYASDSRSIHTHAVELAENTVLIDSFLETPVEIDVRNRAATEW